MALALAPALAVAPALAHAPAFAPAHYIPLIQNGLEKGGDDFREVSRNEI